MRDLGSSYYFIIEGRSRPAIQLCHIGSCQDSLVSNGSVTDRCLTAVQKGVMMCVAACLPDRPLEDYQKGKAECVPRYCSDSMAELVKTCMKVAVGLP
jgi:hypothetical protein